MIPDFYIDTDGSTERMKKFMAEADKYVIHPTVDLNGIFEQIQESLKKNPKPRMIVIDSFCPSVGSNDPR